MSTAAQYGRYRDLPPQLDIHYSVRTDSFKSSHKDPDLMSLEANGFIVFVDQAPGTRDQKDRKNQRRIGRDG